MNLVASRSNINNSKLYFSKSELSKILNCYSLGVSKGNWKDYAIYFGKKEATFYMYKHSLSSPDCIITKSKKNKKKAIIYYLTYNNKKNRYSNKIDDLIALLLRSRIHII